MSPEGRRRMQDELHQQPCGDTMAATPVKALLFRGGRGLCAKEGQPLRHAARAVQEQGCRASPGAVQLDRHVPNLEPQ